MLLAAIRRLVILFLVLGATTAVVSALLGFLFDTPQSRAISLGFTVVGSFMLVMGFFVAVGFVLVVVGIVIDPRYRLL